MGVPFARMSKVTPCSAEVSWKPLTPWLTCTRRLLTHLATSVLITLRRILAAARVASRAAFVVTLVGRVILMGYFVRVYTLPGTLIAVLARPTATSECRAASGMYDAVRGSIAGDGISQNTLIAALGRNSGDAKQDGRNSESCRMGK